MTRLKFDRNSPFNDLPLLPPLTEIDDDSDILKKLVSASRALASVNINVMSFNVGLNWYHSPVKNGTIYFRADKNAIFRFLKDIKMASTFICLHCGCTCWCNPRVKNQKYCCKKECQQSRISTWKKRQYKTNRNYEKRSLPEQKQWSRHYPADQYQSSYRQSHPDYVIRNQELQRIRNKKRQKIGSTFIVKNILLLLIN